MERVLRQPSSKNTKHEGIAGMLIVKAFSILHYFPSTLFEGRQHQFVLMVLQFFSAAFRTEGLRYFYFMNFSK